MHPFIALLLRPLTVLRKLLQEGVKSNARFAVIIESGAEATIKDLANNQQDQSRTPLERLASELRRRLEKQR